MCLRYLLPTLLIVSSFLTACSVADDPSVDEAAAKKIMEAFQEDDHETVIALTNQITDDSKWKRVRAGALQRRGEAKFFAADIEGSIVDFDAFVALYPEQDPHHWQRGLSYYYAERYEEGKAQFERHQTVNTQDVENAVWHFLCAVRAPGGDVAAAQAGLIPIQGDSRVPMKEVHDLFAGRGSVEAVLEAARPDNDETLSDREKNHLCYAHLYLGLYFEAVGETEKSAKHIKLAAVDYEMPHYMGKTARVHALMRGLIEPEGE